MVSEMTEALAPVGAAVLMAVFDVRKRHGGKVNRDALVADSHIGRFPYGEAEERADRYGFDEANRSLCAPRVMEFFIVAAWLSFQPKVCTRGFAEDPFRRLIPFAPVLSLVRMRR